MELLQIKSQKRSNQNSALNIENITNENSKRAAATHNFQLDIEPYLLNPMQITGRNITVYVAAIQV